MKFFLPTLLYAVIALLLGVTRVDSADSESRQTRFFTLVRDSSAESSIVISSTPTPAAKLAAWEVRHAVERMTGVTLPISTDTALPKGNHILIGDSLATRKLGLKPESFSHVEYRVSVSPERVILFGRDAVTSKGRTINLNAATGKQGTHQQQIPGMYEPQGTLRAAYHFIESLGVRFYGPRHYQCVYPETKQLSPAACEIRREPSIKYTNGICSDNGERPSWAIQKILYDDPSSEEVLLFARRLRTGGIPWYANHTYHHMRYRERFGKKPDSRHPDLHEGYRPEFWPPEGSSSHQLCYSSEALADQVAKDAADYFDGKLEDASYGLPVQGMEIFPVVPNDAGGYCTCEKCQKQLRPYTSRKTPGAFGDGVATDYVFDFANKVAIRLARTHPGKKIAVLAYEGYFWKPANIELEPNVVAVPCPITCSHWNPVQRKNDEQAYQFWVAQNARSGSGTYLWNYYHHPGEIGAMRKHNVFPQFTPTDIHARARKYAVDGVEGIFLCGWGEGLDFYLMMKGFDDPNFDLDDFLNEYFEQSYGAVAGSKLRRFYDEMERIVSDPANYDSSLNQRVFWELQGSAETLNKLEKLLAEARADLSDPLAIRRFAIWDNLMKHLREGHEEWIETKQVLLAKPEHSSIARDYIDPVAVYASEGQRHYRLITGRQMIEATPGIFGTREAKLNITNDEDRPFLFHNGPDGISVTIDLGGVFALEELRIWNYAQNRGYGLTRRGMRNVEIHVAHESDELSAWRLFQETTIPEGKDKEAFEASLVIDCKGELVRYLRIRAKGGKSKGNHWDPGDEGSGTWAGLGQVRMYGRSKESK